MGDDNLNYSINGGAVQTDNIITGITSGGTSNLLHSIPFNPSNAGQYYEFKIYIRFISFHFKYEFFRESNRM